MKRTGAILLTILALSGWAFAQAGPRELTGTNETPEKAQANLLQSIASIYLADLKRDVELNDEQFMAVRPVVQQFMRMRFNAANRRKLLDDRQAFLLSQESAAESDFQQVNAELTKLQNEAGSWETRFLRRVNEALGTRALSPRQETLFRNFNKRFDGRLATLVEQARATAIAPKNQQRPADSRVNQNRKQGAQTSPPNTLRNKQPQPAPAKRPNLTR